MADTKPLSLTSANLRQGNEEIRLPKLSHVVADRLRAQMVAGQLKTGDRLPPEAELLEIYRVSRPTLREALRILEAESLISVARGIRSGATVLKPSADRASQYASLILVSSGATIGELHQARLFLEPPTVRALVVRNDPAVAEQLQALVRDLESAFDASDDETALALLNEFHEALVKSSGSAVLTLLVGMLHIISQKSSSILIEGGSSDVVSFRKNLKKTIAGYRKLAEFISAGDPDAAEEFWRTYMTRAYEFIVRTGISERRVEAAATRG